MFIKFKVDQSQMQTHLFVLQTILFNWTAVKTIIENKQEQNWRKLKEKIE